MPVLQRTAYPAGDQSGGKISETGGTVGLGQKQQLSVGDRTCRSGICLVEMRKGTFLAGQDLQSKYSEKRMSILRRAVSPAGTESGGPLSTAGRRMEL